jgi:hypothetical protein
MWRVKNSTTGTYAGGTNNQDRCDCIWPHNASLRRAVMTIQTAMKLTALVSKLAYLKIKIAITNLILIAIIKAMPGRVARKRALWLADGSDKARRYLKILDDLMKR